MVLSSMSFQVPASLAPRTMTSVLPSGLNSVTNLNSTLALSFKVASHLPTSCFLSSSFWAEAAPGSSKTTAATTRENAFMVQLPLVRWAEPLHHTMAGTQMKASGFAVQSFARGCRMFHAGMIVLLMLTGAVRAEETDLATQLRQLDDKVLNAGPLAKRSLNTMLSDDARERLHAANRRETEAWRKIKTREDWEAYKKPRIEALRQSLGIPAGLKGKSEYHVGRRFEGDGYRLECLVYRSPSGQWVPALLYLPAQKPESMPGILICHSHHNPKTQTELQDMGVMWSQLGCAVLIPDQLCHGER